MLALLEAGREPLWAVLLVGWYFGQVGREAALALLEDYEALHDMAVS